MGVEGHRGHGDRDIQGRGIKQDKQGGTEMKTDKRKPRDSGTEGGHKIETV